MDEKQRVLDALNAISPVGLPYEDWLHIGMALKSEGFPMSAWSEWSAIDYGRYTLEACVKKWDSFNGEGWTVATIFDIAKRHGYSVKGKTYTWDDRLPANAENYEEAITKGAKAEEEPWQMAIRFLVI